jgi:RimJ/RimL family protein N-acetyltransferase
MLDELSFRRPELTDIEDLFIIKNDMEAASLLGGQTKHYTKGDIKKWIEFHNNKNDEVVFVLVNNHTHKVIGHVGLYNIDQNIRKAEYGILIGDKDSRGKGYGVQCTNYMINYAFNKLNLNRVVALVITDNIASKKMFLKCGFNIEGTMIEDNYKNGRYYDVYIMAKLNK